MKIKHFTLLIAVFFALLATSFAYGECMVCHQEKKVAKVYDVPIFPKGYKGPMKIVALDEAAFATPAAPNPDDMDDATQEFAAVAAAHSRAPASLDDELDHINDSK